MNKRETNRICCGLVQLAERIENLSRKVDCDGYQESPEDIVLEVIDWVQEFAEHSALLTAVEVAELLDESKTGLPLGGL